MPRHIELCYNQEEGSCSESSRNLRGRFNYPLGGLVLDLAGYLRSNTSLLGIPTLESPVSGFLLAVISSHSSSIIGTITASKSSALSFSFCAIAPIPRLNSFPETNFPSFKRNSFTNFRRIRYPSSSILSPPFEEHFCQLVTNQPYL